MTEPDAKAEFAPWSRRDSSFALVAGVGFLLVLGWPALMGRIHPPSQVAKAWRGRASLVWVDSSGRVLPPNYPLTAKTVNGRLQRG